MQNKVSVIVATCNDDKRLARTITSFLSQTYKNKELVVVDGGSKKGAGEVIAKYKKYLVYVSALPAGISDAFNRGVEAASGDYLYFIGAGDFLWSKDVLEKMMKNVNPNKDLLVCGRINRVSEDGKKLIYTSSLNFKKWMWLYKMGLPHQALFTSKKYFEKYGNFDISCKYAMDYELLLRSYRQFSGVVMKDVVVAAWREGGIGQGKVVKILDEYHRIRTKNKIEPRLVLWIIYLLTRLRYFK